jgi:hypothetical protein
MVEKGLWAWIGRLVLAAMVAGGVAIVAWPATQFIPQDAADPDHEKAAAAEPQPKPPPDAEKRAKPDEPAPGPGWLDAQDMSGSSAESEQAVTLALSWLAEHQLAVGGWSFDHRLGRCQGRCSNPGKAMAKAVAGATGMALLPFIDHGNTHQIGPYRQNVAAGLQFLIARLGKDGSLWEQGGTMYSHALGLLALCEDLRVGREASGGAEFSTPAPAAATGKKAARPATSHAHPSPSIQDGRQALQQQKEQQQRDALDRLVPTAASHALAFALACQDPRRGGWRYEPRRSDSDISVTGWHVMALHSAAASDLPIPARTVLGVTALLDALQGDYGAIYGYYRSAAEATPTRSSIGLLCRVYTGWNRPQLQRGVEKLATVGPSENDMYYNYYATLLLHHYGGPLWDDWNRKLRDYLIRTQSRQGHESGSWSFPPCHSNTMGGRHFDTCMACLILETYYRSKPAYPAPQPDRQEPAARPEKAGEGPGKSEKPAVPPAGKAGEAPAILQGCP